MRKSKRKVVVSVRDKGIAFADININDVLCGGRGSKYCAQSGNQRYHSLVKHFVPDYKIATQSAEKTGISKAIVSAILSATPPGRFLSQSQESGLWYNIGNQRAREKTRQLLLRKNAMNEKRRCIETTKQCCPSRVAFAPLTPCHLLPQAAAPAAGTAQFHQNAVHSSLKSRHEEYHFHHTPLRNKTSSYRRNNALSRRSVTHLNYESLLPIATTNDTSYGSLKRRSIKVWNNGSIPDTFQTRMRFRSLPNHCSSAVVFLPQFDHCQPSTTTASSNIFENRRMYEERSSVMRIPEIPKRFLSVRTKLKVPDIPQN